MRKLTFILLALSVFWAGVVFAAGQELKIFIWS